VTAPPGWRGGRGKGRLQGGGDAGGVQDMAQNPFQDIMEKRGLCSQGRASRCMVDVGVEEGGPANALHSGGAFGSRTAWTSPLLSSRARGEGRVSSQA
jgi:hypothetical protein